MDYESGEFGRGGQQICAVELIYRGNLGEPFIAFAMDRARRLSLAGWIIPQTDEVRIVVQGPQAMVESFEIVCSLGPIEAFVRDWDHIERAPGLNLVDFTRGPAMAPPAALL